MPFDDLQESDEATTPSFRQRPAYVDSQQPALMDDDQAAGSPSGLLFPDERLHAVDRSSSGNSGDKTKEEVSGTCGCSKLARRLLHNDM